MFKKVSALMIILVMLGTSFPGWITAAPVTETEQTTVMGETYGSSVTPSVYATSLFPGTLTLGQIQGIKEKFTVEVWQLAAYFYPELTDLLSREQLQTLLTWTDEEASQRFFGLSDEQVQELMRLAPAVVNHFVPREIASEPIKRLEKKDGQQTEVDSLEERFHTASSNGSFLFEEDEPYIYMVNTDQAFDPIYRVSTQRNVDLHLPGKHGLDLELVRTYNSMQSQASSPYYSMGGNGEDVDQQATSPYYSPSNARTSIAAGWDLLWPKIERTNRGDLYWYLEDGSQYWFKTDPSGKYYPYQPSYENAELNVKSVWGGANKFAYELIIDKRIKYVLEVDTSYGNLKGKITKSNQYGDTIIFNEDQSIVDSANRTITIIRQDGKIVGIQVTNAAGEITHQISYDIEEKTSAQNFWEYHYYINTDDESETDEGYRNKQTTYHQLNQVRDGLANKVLWTYTYYERGPARHANYQHSSYSEFDYLLMKEAIDDSGFTIHYMYRPFDKSWRDYANDEERNINRGTINHFAYREGPTYVHSGYHPVTKVFYKYTNADGEEKILEQRLQGQTGSNPQIRPFVLNDSQTITVETLYGDYTQTESSAYRSNGFGVFLQNFQEARTASMSNGLLANDGTALYSFTNSIYTAYQYEGERKTKPYLIKTFDAGNGADPRTQAIKDFLLHGNSRSYPPGLEQYAKLEKIEYNAKGYVVSTEDSYGNTVEYLYNGYFNQLTYMKQESADGLTKLEEFRTYSSVHGELTSVKRVSTYRNPANGSEVRTDTFLTEYLDFHPTLFVPTVVKETSYGTQFDEQPQTVTRSLEYDAQGIHVTKETVEVTLASGQATTSVEMSYQYDTKGRLTQQTYPDGSTAHYQYDYKNRQTAITFTPSPSNPGQARTVNYSYNDVLREITRTSPDGEKTVTTYTPYGEIDRLQKKVGNDTRTLLSNLTDSSGKLVKETRPFGSASMKTSFQYGGNGAIQKATNALGQETNYVYANTAYALNGSSAYVQHTTKTVEPDGRELWSYTDRAGRVTKQVETSPTKTRTTLYSYTPFGQVSQKQVTAGSAVQTTQYGYDAFGNLIYLRDDKGQVYTYTYNQFGQAIAHYINGVVQKQIGFNEVGWALTKTNAGGQQEKYSYHSNGQQAEYIDKAGQIRTTTYTPYNEPNRISVKNHSGNELYWKQYAYDSATRLVTGITSSENEPLSYTYDGWKRTSSQNAAGRTYSFGYDAYDRLQTVTYPDGAAVTYGYDAINRIQSVHYPSMGTVNMSYSVSPNTNLYQVTYPNQKSDKKTRDAFKELVSVEHLVNNGVSNWSASYTYDGFGNIQSILQNGENRSFQYDGLNRITTEQSPNGSASYTYDDRGNRLTLDSTQLQVLSSMDTSQMTYNAMDELTSYTSAGNTAAYTYYGDGLRASKTLNGDRTRYVYLNGKVIEELDANGNVKARNIWGNELLWRQDNTTSRAGYYSYNGHGDVISITDGSGQMLNRYEYDIWGNLTAKIETMSNPFRYTGEIQDDESGFIYLRARYYDPSMGRFINEDTYEGDISNPLSLNLYTYVHNNPLRYVDPSGHKIEFARSVTKNPRDGTPLIAPTDDDMVQYNRAIEYLKQSDTAAALIARLEASENLYTVVFNSLEVNQVPHNTNLIMWDPYTGLEVTLGNVQSSAMGLIHEFGHAAITGPHLQKMTREEIELDNMKKYETPVAKELGEPTRKTYGDDLGTPRMNNSTHFQTSATSKTYTGSWLQKLFRYGPFIETIISTQEHNKQ